MYLLFVFTAIFLDWLLWDYRSFSQGSIEESVFQAFAWKVFIPKEHYIS